MSPRRPLDFFVLQSSTGAGLALSRFLSAHPQIAMPPRDATDRAFQTDGEGQLEFPDDGESRKRGMLLHHRVQLEAGVPSRVAALCDGTAPNTFVQLVRDPVEVVRATHRRYELARVRNALAERIGRPAVPGPPAGVDGPEQIYDWLAPRLHYHHQGARFAPSFSKWIVLDSADLWPQRVNPTMAELFADLGVDPGFRTPLFLRDFHGTVTKLLHFSQQPIVVSGANILVRLCRARDVATHEDGFTRRLATVEVPESQLSFDLGDSKLCLVMAERTFQRLPRPIRDVLPDNGALDRHLRDVLVPQWMEHAEHIHAEVERRVNERFPNSLLCRMRDELVHDLHALYRLRPELGRRWTALHEVHEVHEVEVENAQALSA